MTRIDLRAALDMLPRMIFAKTKDARDRYCVRGPYLVTNSQLIPKTILNPIAKIIHRTEETSYRAKIEWVDLCKGNVWVLHRTLKVSHLMFLYRQSWKFQHWKRSRLPIYIRYKGRIIIWNGTHRMCLGRLARRKIRAKVVDIKDFLKFEKNTPHRGVIQSAYVKPKAKKGKHK